MIPVDYYTFITNKLPSISHKLFSEVLILCSALEWFKDSGFTPFVISEGTQSTSSQSSSTGEPSRPVQQN